MRTTTRHLPVLLATVLTSACAALPSPAVQVSAPACFWMENRTGRYEWVAAARVYGRELTRRECFALDSCDGGAGGSGGGCYKWADAPTAPRHPW